VAKDKHEIRDPIHVFVRLDNDERKVLNSRPFQRLRHIHQLGPTYLVYPGATHNRFEHSLGVMELASRVFDIVSAQKNVTDEIRNVLEQLQLGNEDKIRYWCRVLRMAALCHDIGHLPFSHAAEKELLPEDWDHERLTIEIIVGDELKQIWKEMEPPLNPEDIVKLAVGPGKAKDMSFSRWEEILSEIIAGDAFGVDRMDYLLRDSHHAGVAYGRFDHYRLVDTLRILPSSPSGEVEETIKPALGVEEGGIQSAEALMWARYLMYSQVYFHPVRRIYDIHLKDFLKEWLPDGKFSTDIDKHTAMTDAEVTTALLSAAFDNTKLGHKHARRLMRREHFKLLYRRNPSDIKINPESGKAIWKAAEEKFGADCVRYDSYSQKGGAPDFPVKMLDGRIESSLSISDALQRLPVVALNYVFVDRGKYDEAEKWLERNRETIIKQPGEEAGDGRTE
jgi:hypothetical protein